MRNSALYLSFLEQQRYRSVRIPWPNGDGFFTHGFGVALLPYLRVYWPYAIAPGWESQTWLPQPGDTLGFTRYMNATHALSFLHHYAGNHARFVDSLARAMDPDAWLVALDWPMELRHEILDRRVETIRVSLVETESESLLRWTRDPMLLPDRLRSAGGPGIDTVNTPENAKAGLVRYLCAGWNVATNGTLEPPPKEVPRNWSPATISIPYRTSNAPRRLMLGASLLAHSVPLVSKSDAAGQQIDRPEALTHPPGSVLRALFSLLDGWTHEDAVVISESAADKLTADKRFTYRIAIPRHVGHYLPMFESGDRVLRGQPLVRAMVDLFALGSTYLEAGKLESRYLPEEEAAKCQRSPSGFVDVALPHSTAPEDAQVVKVTERQAERDDPRFYASLDFEFHATPAVRVGDKLATWHGVKGVVSRILPDAEMPDAGGRPAEIVLNPAGIFRRSAMGLFREAAGAAEAPELLPRHGDLFVMRQPHDAAKRWSARGGRTTPAGSRGQRYGWMELLSVQSQGAQAIAAELLSSRRTTAPWIAIENELLGSHDPRVAATRALNRYLQLAGCRYHDGTLDVPMHDGLTIVVGSSSADRDRGFIASAKFLRQLNEIEEHLDDDAWWRAHSGGAYIDLSSKPVTITDKHWTLGRASGGENARQTIRLQFHHLPVLPPWLRPATEVAANPLTSAYRHVLRLVANEEAWKKDGAKAWLRCVRFALGSPLGMQEFIRREILGRRLTRSARAVIAPDPTLRPDQIRLPRRIFDTIFEGLPEANRELVLLLRNPTLQRRGLLALRPLPPTSVDVLQVPLGILSVMGADFDGDQAVVAALEDDASLAEARRLVPGAVDDLRRDPFRDNSAPAFPLLNELSDPGCESVVAGETSGTAEEWCASFLRMQQAIVAAAAGGWSKITSSAAELLQADLVSKGKPKEKWHGRLYAGSLSEAEWFTLAAEQMGIIYSSVRKKGSLGGVLRREYYHRTFRNADQFREALDACQVVTERMTQQALSVKSGGGTKGFRHGAFFKDPWANAAELSKLEESDTPFPLRRTKILKLLADRTAPTGLLALLANPRPQTLLRLAWQADPGGTDSTDPRIQWFLADWPGLSIREAPAESSGEPAS